MEAQSPTQSDPAHDGPLHGALMHLLDGYRGSNIHVSDLLNAMGPRGFGFVYILFGMLAAALPTGLCSVMAVPILLFSAQQALGRHRPTMPKRFDGKQFSADTVQAGIQSKEKWLLRLERFAKPRWHALTGSTVNRIAAVCCFILAVVILLPGPFTNVPPGIAIALFGFAMVERDGLLMLISFIAGIIGFTIGLSAVIATVLLIERWIAQSGGLPGA